MSERKPESHWRTIATMLFGAVCMLVGAWAGDLGASVRYAGLHKDLIEHERLVGHPIIEERVGQFQKQLDRIENQVLFNSNLLASIAGPLEHPGNAD